MASEAAAPRVDKYEGLTRDDLLRAFRNMVTSRRIDDRDDNAATNIKAVGLTVSAHGEAGRPSKAKALQGGPRRSANLKTVVHESA